MEEHMKNNLETNPAQLDVENSMRAYYRLSFPAEMLFNILEIQKNREISFSTADGKYMRYLTFENCDVFKEKIGMINPRKLDVGPFYDIKPSKGNGAIPIARELVFDIDLTDYPRQCCVEKKICAICYEKIKCAIKLLDYVLSKELGFRRYGFVFSGRRGLHCWVFEMRELPGNVRNDIFKYFNTIIEKNLYVKEYDDIMKQFGDYDLIQNFFIRIDKQVTTSMNHLIKMPFSVHPDSLNISVPLDPLNITELADIPTLADAVNSPAILDPFVKIMNNW